MDATEDAATRAQRAGTGTAGIRQALLRGEVGLEARDHVERERRRPRPVDDAVVERDRDVADRAHDDLAVADDGARADPVDRRGSPTSGWLTSGVTSEAAELAGARDGERRRRGAPPASASPRARSRRAAPPPPRARRATPCRSRARPARRDPGRSGRRSRGRSARGSTISSPSSRAFSSGNSRSAAAVAGARAGRAGRASTPVKSHSSTNVTAATSRCARVRCSAIRRRTPAQRLAALAGGLVFRTHELCLRRAPRTSLSDDPARSGPSRRSEARSTPSSGREPADERRRLDALATRACAPCAQAPASRLAPARRRPLPRTRRRRRRSRRAPCRPGRRPPRRRGSARPCRPLATGSRPSSCRSGSRRAGRPRRPPGPRRRASARSRPRSGPRRDRAA